MLHLQKQIPHCLLVWMQSLQIPAHCTLESHVVQDLLVRPTTQFVPPPQIDWYGPSRPSTLYMVSTQSNLMTSTSSNSQSGVQRFFQEFRLPDYTLDSFSGRLLDVVSSTTFSSVWRPSRTLSCHHQVNGFLSMYLKFYSLLLDYSVFGFLNFICDFFCIYRLFDILEPGMCHFIDPWKLI